MKLSISCFIGHFTWYIFVKYPLFIIHYYDLSCLLNVFENLLFKSFLSDFICFMNLYTLCVLCYF